MTTTAHRRDLLLSAAADLFAERGFHAVGIDDIGEAAGITGPGVYRHFPSKQALLVALIDGTMDRMLGLAKLATGLHGLIDHHVDLVVEEKALISCWVREQRALGEDVHRSLRRRMRSYEGIWREAVAPLRQDLDPAHLALTVGAALAMLNTSSLIDNPLPTDGRKRLLRDLTVATLGLTA